MPAFNAASFVKTIQPDRVIRSHDFNPTFSSLVDVDSIIAHSASFTQHGELIECVLDLGFHVQPDEASSSFRMSIPIEADFLDDVQAIKVFGPAGSPIALVSVKSVVGAQAVEFTLNSITGDTDHRVMLGFMYRPAE